jgi:hypothetical protein
MSCLRISFQQLLGSFESRCSNALPASPAVGREQLPRTKAFLQHELLEQFFVG